MSLKDQIIPERLPEHVAVIMDGNGRWAKQKGKNRIFGHKNGVLTVRRITEAGARLGIKYMTFYAFSKENWNRPPTEVKALMGLLIVTMKKYLDELHENNIRFQVIGDVESLPSNVLSLMQRSMEKTRNNTGMTLNWALSYGSRWEITEAVKKIAQEAVNGTLKIEDVTEDVFSKYLQTAEIPDPELMIRTSGEYRISNFLMWQAAYSELYFTDKLWPDFSEEDFYEAIVDFQRRERRFGKTGDQIQNSR